MSEQTSYTIAISDILKAWLPVLTIVVGAVWTAYTYLDHQKDIDRVAAQQAAHEAITRRIEAQKPFLEKQLALYFETAQVTGRLATLNPYSELWAKDDARFWQLYWSELSMVESSQVEEEMVKVGKALNNYAQHVDNKKAGRDLDVAVYHLAHAIRDGIESSWSPGKQ